MLLLRTDRARRFADQVDGHFEGVSRIEFAITPPRESQFPVTEMVVDQQHPLVVHHNESARHSIGPYDEFRNRLRQPPGLIMMDSGEPEWNPIIGHDAGNGYM